MINHRGPRYKEIIFRVTDRLKRVFVTQSDMYIITGSGTAAMEAAVVNTLSPGDKVLCASVGAFGERFGTIAEVFGAKVTWIKSPQGMASEVTKIREALAADPEIKAVLVTHNETSTGVTNDLESIARVVKGEYDKLLLVDGVSSVGMLPLYSDAWGCDAVATASQKGWLVPPGMSFLSFSKRAWQAQASAKMPRYYFDLAQYQHYFEIGQPPFTPAVSIMFALDAALEKIINEGVENVWKRHAEIGRFTREGVKALGLKLLADEKVASNSITAVKVPDGVDGKALVSMMDKTHDIVLAGGQGPLTGKIFRIGHLGWVNEDNIDRIISCLKLALSEVKSVPA